MTHGFWKEFPNPRPMHSISHTHIHKDWNRRIILRWLNFLYRGDGRGDTGSMCSASRCRPSSLHPQSTIRSFLIAWYDFPLTFGKSDLTALAFRMYFGPEKVIQIAFYPFNNSNLLLWHELSNHKRWLKGSRKWCQWAPVYLLASPNMIFYFFCTGLLLST